MNLQDGAHSDRELGDANGEVDWTNCSVVKSCTPPCTMRACAGLRLTTRHVVGRLTWMSASAIPTPRMTVSENADGRER